MGRFKQICLSLVGERKDVLFDQEPPEPAESIRLYPVW